MAERDRVDDPLADRFAASRDGDLAARERRQARRATGEAVPATPPRRAGRIPTRDDVMGESDPSPAPPRPGERARAGRRGRGRGTPTREAPPDARGQEPGRDGTDGREPLDRTERFPQQPGQPTVTDFTAAMEGMFTKFGNMIETLNSTSSAERDAHAKALTDALETQATAMRTVVANAASSPSKASERDRDERFGTTMKPQNPPGFDGTTPDIETWLIKLGNWETRHQRLEQKGPLLMDELKGQAFAVAKASVPQEEWDSPSTFDAESGLKVPGTSGYERIKTAVVTYFRLGYMVRLYGKVELLLGCRRRGRSLDEFLRDFTVATTEAANAGLKISDELKAILAVMFADLSSSQRSTVLGAMETDKAKGDTPDVSFARVESHIRAMGHAYQLGDRTPHPGRSAPRGRSRRANVAQSLAAMFAQEDDSGEEWSDEDGDWDDESEYLSEPDDGESIASDDVEEAMAFLGRAIKRGKFPRAKTSNRPRKGAPRRPWGPKKESVEVCSHCRRAGHRQEKCWMLHPELAPEKGRQKWIDLSKLPIEKQRAEAAKFKRPGGKGAKGGRKGRRKGLLCATPLGTLCSFEQLIREAPGETVVDTGAEGESVLAGSNWVGAYRKQLKAVGGPTIRKIKPTGNHYKFGAGSKKSIMTVELPFKRCERWGTLECDVVGGNLPCLFPLEAQAKFGLDTCIPSKTGVWLDQDGTSEKAAVHQKGGLLLLDLLERPHDGDRTEGCASKSSWKSQQPFALTVTQQAEVPESPAVADDAEAAGEPSPCALDGAETPLEAKPEGHSVVLNAGHGEEPVHAGHGGEPAPAHGDEPAPAHGGEPAPGPMAVRQDPRDDESQDEDEPGTLAISRAEVNRAKKLLDLSDAQLKKLHHAGHPPVKRLWKSLAGQLSELDRRENDAELKSLYDRLVSIAENCENCIRSGPKPTKPHPSLTQYDPFECVEIDFVKLKASPDVWAMSMIDKGTRLPRYVVARDRTAYTAARLFMHHWVRVHGMPRSFCFVDLDGDYDYRGVARHDRGPEFTGGDFTSALESMGVLGSATPAYRPTSHGQVERANRTLLSALKGEKAESMDEYDILLASAENVIANTVSVAGYSPAQCAFGRGTSMHRNLFDDVPEAAHALRTATHPIKRMIELQDKAVTTVQRTIWSRKMRTILAEAYHPEPIPLEELKPGREIMYWRPIDKKSDDGWRGPAVIMAVTPNILWAEHNGVQITTHPGTVAWAAGQGALAPSLPPPDVMLPDLEELVERDDPNDIANAPIPLPDIGLPEVDQATMAPSLVEPEHGHEPALDPMRVTAPLRVKREIFETPSPVAMAGAGGISSSGTGLPMVPSNPAEVLPDFAWPKKPRKMVPLPDRVARCDACLGKHRTHTRKAGCRHEKTVALVASRLGKMVLYDATVKVPKDTPPDPSDNKYLLDWDDLPVEAQVQAYREEYKIWRQYEVFDAAITSLPSGDDVQDFDGRWVEKAQHKYGAVKGKARWTPKGFRDTGAWEYRTDSPTCSTTSLLLSEVWGQANEMEAATVDIHGAFFQGLKTAREGLHVRAPEEWYDFLVEDGYLTKAQVDKARSTGRPIYLHLLKDVPGLNAGPRSFWLALDQHLREFALDANPQAGLGSFRIVRSLCDPCLYLMQEFDVDSSFLGTRATIGTHVDDLRMRAKSVHLNLLKDYLEERFGEGTYEAWNGKGSHICEFRGWTLETSREGVYVDQTKYIDAKLKPLVLDKAARNNPDEQCTSALQKEFESKKGALQWVIGTRGDVAFRGSRHASASKHPLNRDAVELSKTIDFVKETSYKRRFLPTMVPPLRTVTYCDSSHANLPDGRTQGGYVASVEGVELGCAAAIEAHSGPLGRVATTPFDGETIQTCDAVDATLDIQARLSELENGSVQGLFERVAARHLNPGITPAPSELTKGSVHTDSMSLVDAVGSTRLPKCKRRRVDVAQIRSCLELGDLDGLDHQCRAANPSDPLTNDRGVTCESRECFDQLYFEGVPPDRPGYPPE